MTPIMLFMKVPMHVTTDIGYGENLALKNK